MLKLTNQLIMTNNKNNTKRLLYLLAFVTCQARSQLSFALAAYTSMSSSIINMKPTPSSSLNFSSSSSSSSSYGRCYNHMNSNCYSNVNNRYVMMIGGDSTSNRSLTIRGGAGVNYVPPDAPTGYTKCPLSKLTRFLASMYGSVGVALVLLSSVRRLIPIALEPIRAGALPPVQIAAYVVTCAYFAYTEGYKGFQKKFAPMVVARSLTLQPFQGTPFHHYLLAPFYSMGLFHATKKRMIVSWSVTALIGVIVAVVKRLPYPWRNIVDSGVVVGLSWGAISILLFYAKAKLTGKVPDVDKALPLP